MANSQIQQCASCHRAIFAGEEAIEEDGYYYCKPSCYVDAGDAQYVTVGEES